MTGPHEDPCNIADGLRAAAGSSPGRIAVVIAERRGASPSPAATFAELDRLVDVHAARLAARGFGAGMRTLVLVPPGLSLIATVFAILRIGAVPVLVDPGLGRRDFLRCVEEARPAGLVGVPRAHVASRLFPRAFASVDRIATPGPARARAGDADSRAPGPVTAASDVAAVAFTSGSTGPPKGVVYRHGEFSAQVRAMREDMNVRPGEVHLSAVYIFALFNPALGVTTVIPDMDPARPHAFDPASFVDTIERHGVTFSLGSPTVWRRVADHCAARGIRLASLRRIFLFGAPVPPSLVARARDIMIGGRVYTPYGATEALPLTMIDDRDILSAAAPDGTTPRGVCVGRPVRGVDVAVIEPRQGPIASWRQARPRPVGRIGEIAVRGDVVTREYLARPHDTARAKIPDDEGFWHRMGDLGYLDDLGRLWFCGRGSHAVETARGMLLPVPCEGVFNVHPAVERSALVGVGPRGRERPVLVVQPRAEYKASREELTQSLRAMARASPLTRDVETFLFSERLPMDVRHHAKIRRELVARWAAKRLR